MTFHIEAEIQSDDAQINALLETCFGPDRKGRTVYQFRKGTQALRELCFVARAADGRLLGSIRFWPVRMPDGSILPMLGPLAVNPAEQGRGIGRTLITHGLGGAERMGFPGVLIVGKPDYYAPFGFHADLVRDLELPGPVAPLTFMGMEFSSRPGGMAGHKGMVAPAGPLSLGEVEKLCEAAG